MTSTLPYAKIIVLGDTNVGKTSLLTRYVQGTFNQESKATVGASFWTKKIVVDDNKIALQLWDTAGQERFRSINSLYYRGSKAALLVFDVTSTESFENMKGWYDELKRNVDDIGEIVIGIAANKADLEGRLVAFEDVMEYAATINAICFETTAKKNLGIEEIFVELTRRILEKGSFNYEVNNNGEKEELDGDCC